VENKAKPGENAGRKRWDAGFALAISGGNKFAENN